MSAKETVAILGGTGDLGTGLAIRWSKAGYKIVIGSRTQEKADEAVAALKALSPDTPAEAMENGAAAKAGDIVVSPDKWGRLQPGRVTRTMTNIATHILDFWGTGVTPGHVYNCADGPLKGGFAPLMDILRMDDAIMRADGTMIRAATLMRAASNQIAALRLSSR